MAEYMVVSLRGEPLYIGTLARCGRYVLANGCRATTEIWLL